MAADRNAERIGRLKQKYDAKAIDNGLRLRPDDFLDEVEWRDRIDQHYTRSWLEFTYGGLFTRKGLDEKQIEDLNALYGFQSRKARISFWPLTCDFSGWN